MRTDDDPEVARALARAGRTDSLEEARDLAELEHRLFGRKIEPVRLNRYVLLERLASGGFGAVYLGYDPELDRRVAIKLLHGRGGDSETRVRARDALLREAQAMAKFSHPNVVAVHDVGTFDAGESSRLHALGPTGGADGPGTFIVMELVDGVTLQRWLGAETRTPREILDVFIQAGEGLAAAHRADLVHGDFKPANVIVGDDRRVRILDFGLARASPEVEAPDSDPDLIMGTPAYMAPEQLEGGRVDARADQYAFALTLREALYGVDPRVRQSTNKLQEWTSESTASTAVPRYVRDIVTRALNEDPSDRFPDMTALLDVLTRRRRRRTERWVAAAGTLALVVGVGSWVAGPAAGTCNADGQLAGIWDAPTRTRLHDQFLRTGEPDAVEIWESVASALDEHTAAWSSAWAAACKSTTAGDEPSAALAGQLVCLERDLQRLGGVTRVFGEADAMIVLRASESVLALPSPDRCAAAGTREPILPTGASRAEALAVEAEIVRAGEVGRAGRLEDAVALARAAAERAEAAGATATLAGAQLALGTAQRIAGNYADATVTLEQTLATAERAGASDLVVRAMAELIRAFSEMNERDRAEGALLVAESRLARGDVGDAAAAELHYQAGVLRMAQGRPEASIRSLEEGLSLATRVYGGEHPRTAGLRNSLGNAHKDAGNLGEAESHLQAALRIWTDRLGPRHPNVALALNNLGNVRMRQDRETEGLELYTRARDVGLSAYPEGHPHRAIFHANLGDALAAVGLHARAAESYGKAVEIRRNSDEGEGENLADPLFSRGYSHRYLGRYALAIEDLRGALAIREKVHGPGDLRTLRSQDALAEVLGVAGHLEEARELHERALAGRIAVEGPDHRVVSISHVTLAATLERMGDVASAREHRERALAIRQEIDGPDSVTVAWARLSLGASLVAEGEHREALAVMRPAFSTVDAAGGLDDVGAIDTLGRMARAYLGVGDGEAAQRIAERGLRIADATEGLEPMATADFDAVAARAIEKTDPVRARELACRATMAVADVPGRDALRGELATWLRRNGGPCEETP